MSKISYASGVAPLFLTDEISKILLAKENREHVHSVGNKMMELAGIGEDDAEGRLGYAISLAKLISISAVKSTHKMSLAAACTVCTALNDQLILLSQQDAEGADFLREKSAIIDDLIKSGAAHQREDIKNYGNIVLEHKLDGLAGKLNSLMVSGVLDEGSDATSTDSATTPAKKANTSKAPTAKPEADAPSSDADTADSAEEPRSICPTYDGYPVSIGEDGGFVANGKHVKKSGKLRCTSCGTSGLKAKTFPKEIISIPADHVDVTIKSGKLEGQRLGDFDGALVCGACRTVIMNAVKEAEKAANGPSPEELTAMENQLGQLITQTECMALNVENLKTDASKIDFLKANIEMHNTTMKDIEALVAELAKYGVTDVLPKGFTIEYFELEPEEEKKEDTATTTKKANTSKKGGKGKKKKGRK